MMKSVRPCRPRKKGSVYRPREAPRDLLMLVERDALDSAYRADIQRCSDDPGTRDTLLTRGFRLTIHLPILGDEFRMFGSASMYVRNDVFE